MGRDRKGSYLFLIPIVEIDESVCTEYDDIMIKEKEWRGEDEVIDYAWQL